MEQEKEIEVEVVEIDGVTTASGQEMRVAGEDNTPFEQRTEGHTWQQWQGRVRQLDSRWWPLWALLGVLALILLATVGVVVGLVALVIVLCQRLFRALFR